MKSKITLLYAEDEVETRENHMEYLKEHYDFTFFEANDGEEALELFKKHQPHIILTDITMPKMDGLSFVSKVRESSPHTKVIMLTAYNEQEKLMKAFELDVVNYLIKPINRKKLSNAIDLALTTLPSMDTNDAYCRIDSNTRWDSNKKELYSFGENISLSQYEKELLALLCEYKGIDISSYDIFEEVWGSETKEYSKDSVRTLIKKLRKKLPEDILKNSYGGFYKLSVG
jgi:DNA-binding response OmpR family regulator